MRMTTPILKTAPHLVMGRKSAELILVAFSCWIVLVTRFYFEDVRHVVAVAVLIRV